MTRNTPGMHLALSESLSASQHSFRARSETCIKGHRSSTCKHTDRPLYEIKKKGRPVTQCEHCRELRKTKQVHVKCKCGSKDQNDATPESDVPSTFTPPSASASTLVPVNFIKKKGDLS